MNRLKNITKPRTWSMALLLVAFVAGCGGGGAGSGGDPILGGGGVGLNAIIPGAVCPVAGATIPTATASNPVSGNLSVTTSTVGVAGNGKLIMATFSLAMNATTINATTYTLSPVGGVVLVPASVTYNATSRVATFTTSSALLADTAYRATITTGATSAAGTPLACNYAWNFRTAVTPGAGLPPQDLGILAPFGIASAGGITNTGATKINGDVVLAPNQNCNAVPVGAGNDFGACGGNPLNVPTNNSGDLVITQIFPDTTTADAVMAVLLVKWNSISPAGTPGATVLGCGTIGSAGGAGVGIGCAGNSTLPPGTYISAASSTIDVTGDLTLDAAGNADAVWVFQAPSALNTLANSRILLVGGAKASNVWWFVGSSATLVTSTVFQGNILASASIALGTGATSCGRLLAGAEGAGAFTFLANTVSVPGHPSAPVGCE